MTADERLRKLEAWLSNLYKDSEEEIRGKWDKYMAQQEKRAESLLRAVSDAKTDEERTAADEKYKQFLKSKCFGNNRYRQIVDELAKGFANANTRALNIINGQRASFFADGYNFSAGEINEAAVSHNVGIRFDLCDEETINWLAKRTTDFPNHVIMPPPDKLKIPEDERWSAKLINSQVAQGIAQGESIPKIARRLESVTDGEKKACVRRARTMATNCQNAGRVSSMNKAADWGVQTRKKWICTHDNRTRDNHLALDGETIDNNAVFWNGCRWPGDHLGPPQEVWNCRCTMVTVVDGFSSTLPKGKEGAVHITFDREEPVPRKIAETGAFHVSSMFTQGEIEALTLYTRSAYSGINNYLREGGLFATDDVKNIVNSIDGAMEKSVVAESLELYRGSGDRELVGLFGDGKRRSWFERADNLKSLVGKTAKSKSYISTSKEGLQEQFSRGVEWEFVAHPGVHAIDVSQFSVQQTENEVLVDRETTIEILSVDVPEDEEGYVNGKIRIKAILRR